MSLVEEVKDEDLYCEVCRDGGWHEANKIVFCESCHISVHQTCYGIEVVPGGDIPWYCNLCFVNQERKRNKEKPIEPICLLCHEKKGSFKMIKLDQWIHCSCALATPEISFKEVPTLQHPIGYDLISVTRRKNKICLYCGVIKGITVCCHATNCVAEFHIRCGQRNDCIFELRASSGEKKSFCAKHKNYFYKFFGVNKRVKKAYQAEKNNKPTLQGVAKKVIKAQDLWNRVKNFTKKPVILDVKSIFTDEVSAKSILASNLKKSCFDVSEEEDFKLKGSKSTFRFDFDMNQTLFSKQNISGSELRPIQLDKKLSGLLSYTIDGLEVVGDKREKYYKGFDKCDELLQLKKYSVYHDESLPTTGDKSKRIYQLKSLLHRVHQQNEDTLFRIKTLLRKNNPEICEEIGISEEAAVHEPTVAHKKLQKNEEKDKNSKKNKVEISDDRLLSALMNVKRKDVYLDETRPRIFGEAVNNFLREQQQQLPKATVENLTQEELLIEFDLYQSGFNTSVLSGPLKSSLGKRKSLHGSPSSKSKALRAIEEPLMIYVHCLTPGVFVCSKH